MVEMGEETVSMTYKPGGPAVYEQMRRNKRDDARHNYNGEEDSLVCARFPHLNECTIPGESA